MMPEEVGSQKSEVRSWALNVEYLKLTDAYLFLEEVWHTNNSYFLVGITNEAYKTC
ncbi:MAG: hypothetical protein Q7J86_09690 [Bacteroidota bacterium]|nr:hypothetical protein [Bacteroidota bacterium]MDO9614781.1 hypothetical protein [Bacteroidota bacterium]